MVRFVEGQIIYRFTNNLSFCQFPRPDNRDSQADTNNNYHKNSCEDVVIIIYLINPTKHPGALHFMKSGCYLKPNL